MSMLLRVFGALAIPAFLAACAAPQAGPAPQPQPVIPAAQYFNVDVASVEIQHYGAPAPGTTVDLRGTIDAWAREHLHPVGASGRLRVIVNDAAIRESVYRRTAPGGTGFERLRQFDGLIDLKLEATDIRTQRSGFSGASASRTDVLPATADPYTIDSLTQRMTQALLLDLRDSVEASLQSRLSRFIR